MTGHLQGRHFKATGGAPAQAGRSGRKAGTCGSISRPPMAGLAGDIPACAMARGSPAGQRGSAAAPWSVRPLCRAYSATMFCSFTSLRQTPSS